MSLLVMILPLTSSSSGGVVETPVYGCTNPAALNYNPLATIDDGSCVLPGSGEEQVLVNALTAIGQPLTADEEAAWTAFVTNTTAAGIYEKLKFFFLYTGDATANAVDAITGNSLITWNGSIIHAGGIKGNGTNGYGVLSLNLQSLIGTPQNSHFGMYITTAAVDNGDGGNSEIDFGVGNASGSQQVKIAASVGYYHIAALGDGFVQAQYGGSGVFTEQLGYFLANRRSSTSLRWHLNDTVLQELTSADVATFLTTNPYVLAFNNNGSPFAFTGRRQACLHGGLSLTNEEEEILKLEIQALMFGFRRAVL